jgi:cysteinyl-tRNA synthetase
MIYDSKQRKKIPFEPEFEKQARLYLCGPTVYDEAHLGHARSAISFDLLRRTLEVLGFSVRFVRNITDVDDKILKKMESSGESLAAIAERYSAAYHRDMAALNVAAPDLEPKATEHIPQMVALIETLLEGGHAYRVENGDIYFDTASDSLYGTLSHEAQEETLSRVESNIKRNSRDFVLWKAASRDDRVFFESPFGPGRPGWHLECSAMLQAHLHTAGAKYACDIHAGGADLFFPHHENEAAQSRCGYGSEIAKYWMHNGFVRIGGEKMSKSLGNSFFIHEALKHWPAEALRFYLMSIHYRAPLHFSDDDLLASRKRLDRLYRLKKQLFGLKTAAPEPAFKSALTEAMSDDLNTSKALAAIDEMIHRANELLSGKPDKAAKAALAGNLVLIEQLLGVGLMDPFEWFQWGVSADDRQMIETQIAKRKAAKAAKDFAQADAIRDALAAKGVGLMDLPGQTVWERI